MKNCVFCGNEFTELSCEHIIPNALCGHLKSNELLCEKCNNTLGNTIDKLLNGKFDMIINMFGLPRESGVTPPASAELKSGRPCSILHGGQPVASDVQIDMTTDSENNVMLHINAPEKKTKLIKMEISKFIAQKKDFFTQHNIDYKKAIPNAIKDVSDKINKDEVKHSHNRETIHFQIDFGGTDFYRPILKILFLFLLHNSKNVKLNRQDIVKKIWTGENINDIFFYCFEPKNLFMYKHISLYHSIGIKSFQKEKKLLGFIDLFGITPYICILDDNYTGEDISLSYGYDLLQGKEERTEINFSELTFNLKDKYDFQNTSQERFAHCQEKFYNLLLLFQFYSIPERIIQDLTYDIKYDSSFFEFLSELKTHFQMYIISHIDDLFPLKEEGCVTLYKVLLYGMIAFFKDIQNK